MTYIKVSAEELASWPQNHKKCRGCQEVLPFEKFHKHKQALLGYANYCKQCRKPAAKEEWTNKSFEKTMLASSRFRAKKKGIPHTISLEDIVIPTHCPILKVEIELVRGSMYAPSLDQIQPGKGYTPDNIIVLSHRANQLKNNASKEEARLLADWMEQNCGWTIVHASTARASASMGNCEVVSVGSVTEAQEAPLLESLSR